MASATELRLGGAMGTDTVAIETVCGDPRIVVYVPWTVREQPSAAREAIARCAQVFVELALPRNNAAFLRRNDVMLAGANRLLAFSDGRAGGGTAYTIRQAARHRIPTDVVPVLALTATNPRAKGEWPAPVYAFARWMSPRKGDWRSNAVVRVKQGTASLGDMELVTNELAEFVGRTPELAAAEAIVVMPRRDPNAESDLAPIGDLLARAIGRPFLRGWLRRIAEPLGGNVVAKRVRFPADAHAVSMRVVGRRRPASVIVLDNVLTTGGTMRGALMAITRDTRTKPAGLAYLYSSQAEMDA